ncbi:MULTISPECIES: type II toxin-antitoxin system HicB family antitoxin [Nostoc]|uniref:type II toxin-antitoxin system HicB family antitoxin n=1 Tax=Nostoc TaxID=1177 RepID=UPI001F54C456|nr:MULTISPECIES: type II toxin-antitoxin system HicB family antitoxin [Nostoc]
MKYTIVIQWSEENNCYVVLLPEFTNIMQPCTHGETYEDALKNAKEVLEMLAKPYQEKDVNNALQRLEEIKNAQEKEKE